MYEIILLLGFLVLSAFFSGSEIALMSISEHRIRFLKEKKRRGAETLAKIRAEKKDLLIVILIGNNIVNIAAAAMATEVALGIFENNAIAIVTGIMTLLILFFGEIVPKAYATAKTQKIALTIAPIYLFLNWILFPLVYFFKFLMKAFRAEAEVPKITEDELKMLIRVGEEEGQIEPHEKDLIQKVFRFNDVEVKEVMTPRTKMIPISSKQPVNEAITLMARHKFSRLPVFEDRVDNIVGIIYLKDLIHLKKGMMSVEKKMHKPFFIHETLTINKLFKELQRRKLQLAIVVDEHGGVSGIVTMEDVLEEIVGEIFDESDTDEHEIKRKSKDSFELLGTATIEEVNKALKTNIEEDVSYDTISGFFQEKIDRIPKAGDVVKEGNWTLTIGKMEGHRIEVIKAIKKR